MWLYLSPEAGERVMQLPHPVHTLAPAWPLGRVSRLSGVEGRVAGVSPLTRTCPLPQPPASPAGKAWGWVGRLPPVITKAKQLKDQVFGLRFLL